MMGQSKSKVEIIDNKVLSFSMVSGLNKGIYVLKIYINDVIEKPPDSSRILNLNTTKKKQFFGYVKLVLLFIL